MDYTYLNPKNYMFWLITGILSYSIVSKLIFDSVYLTSKLVVDEEFHLPLGEAYCNYRFSVWHPKVTTLPGLYLYSTLILGPLHLCTTYWLRLTSLIASVVNIVLFYMLRSKYDPKCKWTNILSSFTLALLPPLYFFSHLYYTDIISLTMVLFMTVFYEHDRHWLASLVGFLSVLCRQTNIIWVAFIAGQYVLKGIYKNSMLETSKEKKCLPDSIRALLLQLKTDGYKIIKRLPVDFFMNAVSYIAVGIGFVIFLYINGSIVVGDKTAHELTIHIPQLFYFSLFCLVFAWPFFVNEIIGFASFAKRHKLVVVVLVILSCYIVYSNTLVHPYLLADNRHYMFYVWNRFYLRYAFFKYLMVPVYIFAWYSIIRIIYDGSNSFFLLMYLTCVAATLVPQKLIEFRYFFTPYVLFRLRVRNTTSTVFSLVLEFITAVLINAITLKLFFTKSIIWSDYDVPQRLIW